MDTTGLIITAVMFSGLTFWVYSAGPFRFSFRTGEYVEIDEEDAPIRAGIAKILFPVLALGATLTLIYRAFA